MDKRKATASFTLALCLYGTIGWALSYIDLPSEVVVLCRGGIGTLFILAVLLCKKRRFDLPAVRANLKWLALSGISLGLNWVLLFAAFRATTVAIATLCNYMAPVILIIVAPWLLAEKRNPKKICCAAIAVLGVVLVSGVVGGGAQAANLRGVALALAAAVGGAALIICNKKMGDVPIFEKASTQLFFSTLTALPFVLINNLGASFHPGALAVGLVIMLGVVHTGIAYCLYFGAIPYLSAQSLAVLGYVEPAVAVLVSTLIMHESLSLLGWLGAALIIGAAAASELVE